MNTNKLNAGIIGCGHLGSIHCRTLKNISSSNSNINFTGIFDIDINKADEIAKKLHVKSFDSQDSLLKEINTLIIATPTSTHFKIAKEAIENGINLFIEKPVTTNLDEARILSELSSSSNIKIQIGHVERFNPALTSLEKYKINPRFIESHRLAQFKPRGIDVSVIQDLMIHDLYIILNLVKSPIEKIDANGVAIISKNIDIANARLKFQNGCVANITSSRISMKNMRKMRLFQQNMYISIDFLNHRSEVIRLVNSNESSPKAISYPVSDDKKIIVEEPVSEHQSETNPIKQELEYFFDSIINNKAVKIPLFEGIQALEVAEEITKIISSQN